MPITPDAKRAQFRNRIANYDLQLSWFFFGEMTQNLAVIKHFYSKATQCCMTKRASFFELTEGESRLFHCRETNI